MMEDDEFENFDEQNESIGSSVRRFEEMLRNHDTYFFDVEALVKIIDYYIDGIQYEKALDVAKYASNLHPNTLSFKIREAHLYSLSGKHDHGLEMLERLQDIYPYETEIFIIRGNILSSLDRFEEAIVSFKKALNITDLRDELYYNIAQAYQSMMDYHQAIHYYKMCATENPNHEMALEELAVCLGLTGRVEEGIAFFKVLIDKDPYSFLAWYGLGDLYCRMGMYEKALEALDYVLIINENYYPAYLDQANVLSLLGRYNDAIDKYKQTFEYFTPDSLTYFNIGECYDKLENYQEARTYFKKAVKITPEMSQAWFCIGLTLEVEERWYEAIHYLKKAIELNPNVGEYWFVLAENEYKLQNITEAEDCYRKALELDPDYDAVWLCYSDFLYQQNRMFDAIETIYTGIKYHPDNSEMHCYYIFYLYMDGQLKEAYLHLAYLLGKDFDSYQMLLNLNPDFSNDKSILQLIEQHRNKK